MGFCKTSKQIRNAEVEGSTPFRSTSRRSLTGLVSERFSFVSQDVTPRRDVAPRASCRGVAAVSSFGYFVGAACGGNCFRSTIVGDSLLAEISAIARSRSASRSA